MIAGPVEGCNTPLTDKVKRTCTKCNQVVCVEHQFPIDHDCASYCKPAAPPKASSIKIVKAEKVSIPEGYFTAGGAGQTVVDIFKIFDRDDDGVLNQQEYADFCTVTEGSGCDDARWATHRKSLSADDAPGLTKEHFCMLYLDARFKKHFGKDAADLEAAKANPVSDPMTVYLEEMENKAMMADAQGADAVKAVLQELMDTMGGKDLEAGMQAAYGLAGAVLGAGMTSLVSCGVATTLQEVAGSKKSKARPAALKTVQLLLQKAGGKCMPYVIHMTGEVLDAAEGATPVAMASVATSAQLVKHAAAHDVALMLPYIMDRFDAKWKIKVAALDMLGALAKRPELASGMHSVMPVLAEPLVECTQDTHPKTSVAAKGAMDSVVATIDNQETQKLKDDLIGAVTQGGDAAASCLAKVMELTFVNAIGAPSLALFVPAIVRGLRETRSSQVAINAAMCAVNIFGLVQDPRQIRPFLPVLVPTLQDSVENSSHPDVRERSQRGLDLLNKELGGNDSEMAQRLKDARQGMNAGSLSAIADGPFAKDIDATVQKYCAVVSTSLAEESMPLSTPALTEMIAKALGPVLAGCGADDKAVVDGVSTAIAEACAPFTGADNVVDESNIDYVLNLRGMILAFGGRVLMKMTDLCLERGKCYGFVGQNGVGKTTLLTRVAAKDIDGIPQDLKVYYVAHEILSESTESVIEYMKSQVPDDCTDEKITTALSEVGFTTKMRNAPCSDLSGGWRMKLAIARSMMWEPELLLLDEPTNHLDHTAVAWLTKYVQDLRGKITVGVVSHEYSFLGDVLTDVVHMVDQKMTYHSGGFKKFQEDNPEIVAALPSTDKMVQATQGLEASASSASLASAASSGGMVSSASATSLATSASSLSMASDLSEGPEPEPEQVEEIDVSFAKDGPIGIIFHLKHTPLTVNKAKEGSQAEEMGVQPDWVVKAVNGAPLGGLDFAGSMNHMKNKTRPLVVTFHDTKAAEANAANRPPVEYHEVDFTEDGPLGIVFKLRHAPLTVNQCKDGSQGDKKKVKAGWVVKAVNGQRTQGLNFADSMALMKDKARPLKVRFHDLEAEKKLAELAAEAKKAADSMGSTGVGRAKGGNANAAIPSTGLKTVGKGKGSKKDLRNMVVEGAKEGTLPIIFPDPGKLAGIRGKTAPVMKMNGCQFQYPGTDVVLLKDATIKLGLGARCALVGKNGAGKTTLMKVLVGELMPNEGVGEHWVHHNLRLSYVAQHSMHHLESCLEASPCAYLQRRFAEGRDREMAKMERMSLTKEEEEERDKRGNIRDIVDRQMRGKQLYYGCMKTGSHYNTVDGVPKSDELDWIPESNLVHKGEYVLKLRRNCDEMIKARNSGMELRPTTLAEVKSHLEDFGIAGDLAVGKIKRMSGGQKVRLVLAAAMWSMPHFLALDEPTNYLDNDTLAALTQALKQFKGGVITISHNEAFVENLCNEYWLVSDGVVTKSDSAKPKIDAAAHGPTAD